MKAIVVLTFDVPESDQIVDVLTAIDPPHLPYFIGMARIAFDPFASAVTDWLDTSENETSNHKPKDDHD